MHFWYCSAGKEHFKSKECCTNRSDHWKECLEPRYRVTTDAQPHIEYHVVNELAKEEGCLVSTDDFGQVHDLGQFHIDSYLYCFFMNCGQWTNNQSTNYIMVNHLLDIHE